MSSEDEARANAVAPAGEPAAPTADLSADAEPTAPAADRPTAPADQGLDDKVKKFHRQPKLDPQLQRELDEALGDASLADILAAEEQAEKGAGGQIKRGKVIAIHGDDIFVDLGGRSEGFLACDQFRDEPLPEVGDEIEVTIEGYDERDGLLVLSREGAVLAATWDSLHVGQIVEGRVTGHNKGGLELTINGIDAFMPVSQIEIFHVEEMAPYVDQKLTCEVSEIDFSAENVIVSRREVLEREAAVLREELLNSLAEGKVITGTVRSIMPYGAFVDLGGVDGLLHVSDMSHARVEDPATIVAEGQKIEVKVLKVDLEERKISLGLKQVLPDPWLGAEVKWPEDQIVTGRITRLADFGAFTELEPGVEGLIPISEFTFERRIRHPSEIVSEGDAVKVRVMNVDTERRRISLSLKRAGDDPWVGASVRWPAETATEGVVTRLADFGAFVELAPGVEGLIHVSELSDSHVRSPADVVREGQTVQVKVLGVDEDARRISLSIKQLAQMADYTGSAGGDQAPETPRKRKRPLKGGLE